jgi:peptide-methionine (R)-S-oxide reductase
MKRRTLLQTLAVATMFPLTPACFRAQVVGEATSPITPLNKPHKEWRELVSPRAYQILFEEATERPESSNLVYEDREGESPRYFRR